MTDFIREAIKRYLPSPAVSFAKLVYSYYRLWISRKVGIDSYKPHGRHEPAHILFYNAFGLYYSGTHKFLQILAKHLNKEEFKVFFMYAPQDSEARKTYLENSGIEFIPFSYESKNPILPFDLRGMSPSLSEIIREKEIDLLVACGAGNPEFPVANFSRLPIIFLNVFGAINPQKNIRKHICISELLINMLSQCLPKEKIELIYIPSEDPDPKLKEKGRALRAKLGLEESDFVFGRIGRPDDKIFDPIGIRAFAQVVKKYPQAHYLIVAPVPSLQKIVEEEKVPNVHYLDPIAAEEDIWAFHFAIDALAHYRKDGETFGLNIAESMICGKPIISHKSVVWNAHLEYLDPSFSRVADIDNTEQYQQAMEEFINLKSSGKITELGEKSRQKAEQLFLIASSIGHFERCVKESLNA